MNEIFINKKLSNVRKFLLSLLFFFIPLFLFFIVANVIIYPYGFSHLVEINGFNQQKEGVRPNIRTVKSLELPLRNPKTIFIGSSRVHDSVNPDLPLFDTYQPTYNLGINMLRIKEARKFLEHAINNSQVENLFFGIDFFMFNGYEKINPAFNEKLIGKKISLFDYLFNPLFFTNVWRDSWNTIKISNKQPQRSEFLENGFRPGEMVFFNLVDYKKLFYYTNWIFMSSNETTPYYGKFKIEEEAFTEF